MPKDFDPEEVPTSPEIGVFCPTCKGEGLEAHGNRDGRRATRADGATHLPNVQGTQALDAARVVSPEPEAVGSRQ